MTAMKPGGDPSQDRMVDTWLDRVRNRPLRGCRIAGGEIELQRGGCICS